MKLWLIVRAVITALSCVIALPTSADAQSNPPNPANAAFKEVQIAAGAFSLADPIPSWVEPAVLPQATGTQPIIFRLADAQFMVGTTPVAYVRRSLKINDAASLTAAGQISISFAPQYQRLQVHAVRIIRGEEEQDRTQSVAIRFLQREVGLEQGIYNGHVTASILVNDLRVGDTLEYSYSLHGQNPVFGGKFVDAAGWDQRYPTLHRRVVLNHPVERSIAWRLIADGQGAPLVPRESTSAGVRKLVFEERGVPELAPEPLTPGDYAAYRWLQFSEFSSWHEVVNWAGGLFRVSETSDAELRGVVESLRARPSNDERVAAALEFVQSEVRYYSLSLGESSHRPAAPALVLSRRYGDCKDKSLLLMTLLDALGIPSKPALLQIGRHRGLEKALPSPQLFDHVIVQATVDGRVFYLDPTRLGQHGRLDRMGQAHQGTQILPVAPDVYAPTVVGPSAPETIRDERSEIATLPKLGGEARLQVRQIWNGLPAENFRVLVQHLPRDQLVKAIGDAMERQYPGAKIVGDPEIRDDRVNNMMSVSATYAVPGLATERDEYWMVRYAPSNMRGSLPTPSSAGRKNPLYLGLLPRELKYSFEVTFPEDVSMVSDPRTETVTDKHFTYTVASAFRGNRATRTIELQTFADRVDAEDLRDYVQHVQQAGNATSGVIAFSKKAIKSSASLASPTGDFAQLLRARLQESIDKMSQTIDSGKLVGNDLADAHCERGSTYFYLGRTDEGLQEVNEAVKIAPNSTTMLSCRGEVYFQAGQFEKSVSDYSRAITLGRTEPKMFYLRGVAKFYAGKLEEAADDLARASNADSFDGQLYCDLWLAWTSRRLGRPVPDVVAKRAAAQPRGEWPRPALAVMTGRLTPEEMLKLIDEKRGDERHMALAEGYFYLGQYYLLQGDKALAAQYFEKTRGLQVVIYTEHAAAAFELQHLKRLN